MHQSDEHQDLRSSAKDHGGIEETSEAASYGSLVLSLNSYLGAGLFALFHCSCWLERQESLVTPVLGWLAALSLSLYAFSQRLKYMPMFIASLIMSAGGFYWLVFTIQHFGGFSNSAALSLFALFALASSIQFIFFVFIANSLPKFFDKACLRTALAYTASETLIPRIFPWQFGHMQLEFTTYAQSAEIGGATLLTFVTIATSELLLRIILKRSFSLELLIPLLIFGLTLTYGASRYRQVEIATQIALRSTPLKIAAVQGNLSLDEKNDSENSDKNFLKYLELSSDVARPDTLVIWPESSVTKWIPTAIFSKKQSKTLALLPDNVPFLFGALTFDSRYVVYNSAIAVDSEGNIPTPYHKRILMPFGEYTPGVGEKSILARYIPTSLENWLKKMNQTAGEFSAGEEAKVFTLSVHNGNSKLSFKIAPLICYEDVIPHPARESVAAGAEILVNLTNDAWFGNSAAPFQHNRIAAFRTIENRRYLIRATNSGLTSIIDPLGRSVASMPVFNQGQLVYKVSPLRIKHSLAETPFASVFAKLDHEKIWLIISFGVILCALINLIYRIFVTVQAVHD